ncbi:MAG: acylphosphatase [Ignavibacteriae bacterium HGW-Ignavibacteriae-3]|nr:MAG: acylphosphatase [Ignavibacteriae bacterium HGW-Ignavibacteriae-3]
MKRAEIIVNGLVQGVGFRYFVVKRAAELGLKGFTKNLSNGEVYTVVEGELAVIEDLFNKIRIGPSHAHVKNASINWSEYKNEFSNFEVRF